MIFSELFNISFTQFIITLVIWLFIVYMFYHYEEWKRKRSKDNDDTN